MNRRGMLGRLLGGIAGLVGIGAAKAGATEKPKPQSISNTPRLLGAYSYGQYCEEVYLCRLVDIAPLLGCVGKLVKDRWACLVRADVSPSEFDGFFDVQLAFKTPEFPFTLALYGECTYADILACMT